MACPARAAAEDPPAWADLVRAEAPPRAANDNPALNLTTTFTPDAVGNVVATTPPLLHVSNATFDQDRRKLLDIDPDPGSGTRTATNTIYDPNGRVIEVDKGRTNTNGNNFVDQETTLTSFDPNGNKVEAQVLNGPVGNTPLTVTQTSYDALNRPICTAERNNAAAFAALPPACAQGPGGAYGPDHISQIGGACLRAGQRPDPGDAAGQKVSETRGVGTSIQGLYGSWTYACYQGTQYLFGNRRISAPYGPEAKSRRISDPAWLTRRDPAQVARLYPAQAAAKGVTTGVGYADCTVAADGVLTACQPFGGDPPDLGFSEAAVQAVAGLRMSPWTDAGGPADGARVRIPITFTQAAGK
jgi:hypothetical protein